MRVCKVEDICRAVGGTLLQGGADITGVSTDSRSVGEGDLFVPLVGERFDGHAYIDMALSKGAEGCLCAKVPETLMEGKSYVLVEDTTRALGDLAGWYRGLFDIPVVQVTGSAGKTTTKEMIASVLGQHAKTLKTLANFNNHIGTPQTLLRLFTSDETLVNLGIRAMYIYFFGFIFMPLQFGGQTTFTALGKAKQAVFFSLLRKAFIVFPLTLLLPLRFGVDGVFLAEPISNVIGGVACFATMMATIWTSLKREEQKLQK